MCAKSGYFTPERRDAEFEHNLRQAIFFGCACLEDPSCLDEETHRAIHAVAREYPNVSIETVLAARQELAWQIDGTHAEHRREQIGSYEENARRYRARQAAKE